MLSMHVSMYVTRRLYRTFHSAKVTALKKAKQPEKVCHDFSSNPQSHSEELTVIYRKILSVTVLSSGKFLSSALHSRATGEGHCTRLDLAGTVLFFCSSINCHHQVFELQQNPTTEAIYYFYYYILCILFYYYKYI